MHVSAQRSREDDEQPAGEPANEPTDSAAGRCRNCDARLTGPYCAHCGQQARHRGVPIAQLGREMLNEVFSLDTRLLRSLRLLLFQPGHLTREYFAGRRKRYVPPFRLYVVVSFVYFLIFALPGVRPYVEDSSAGEPQATVQVPTDSTIQAAEEAGVASATSEQSESRKVAYQLGRMLKEYFSAFLFAFVPLVALGLVPLYGNSGRFYVHHLVFALHLQTLVFIVELPRMILDAALPAGVFQRLADPLMWVSIALASLYALFAVRRFYAQSWWKTVLKTVLLIALYGGAFLLSILSAAYLIVLYRMAVSSL